MKEVAEELGNTPAVARGSYVDPRVVTGYDQGQTIAGAVRRAERPSARGCAGNLGKGHAYADSASGQEVRRRLRTCRSVKARRLISALVVFVAVMIRCSRGELRCDLGFPEVDEAVLLRADLLDVYLVKADIRERADRVDVPAWDPSRTAPLLR